MSKKSEIEILSIGKLIILHLLPGIIITITYILIARSGFLNDYPKLIQLAFAGLISLVPVELGYLFFVSYKTERTFNIFKVLGLKNKMKTKKLIVYTFILFIIAGILMTVLKPLSDYILNTVFNWFPEWFIYIEAMEQYSRPHIIISILVSFFFFTLIAPIVEELYFRGYLLDRMKWMGNYGVILNVFLFAVYHFWSPWLIIARTIALMPLFYFVYKKNSLRLAISVHCLANFTDVIALIFVL